MDISTASTILTVILHHIGEVMMTFKEFITNPSMLHIQHMVEILPDFLGVSGCAANTSHYLSKHRARIRRGHNRNEYMKMLNQRSTTLIRNRYNLTSKCVYTIKGKLVC